jgi:uncharacterized protein YegP (UPF0339 family)
MHHIDEGVIITQILKKGGVTAAAKYQLYKDAKCEFRWKFVASNGQTIATGGEGYKSKASAKAGIQSVNERCGLCGYRRPNLRSVALNDEFQ